MKNNFYFNWLNGVIVVSKTLFKQARRGRLLVRYKEHYINLYLLRKPYNFLDLCARYRRGNVLLMLYIFQNNLLYFISTLGKKRFINNKDFFKKFRFYFIRYHLFSEEDLAKERERDLERARDRDNKDYLKEDFLDKDEKDEELEDLDGLEELGYDNFLSPNLKSTLDKSIVTINSSENDEDYLDEDFLDEEIGDEFLEKKEEEKFEEEDEGENCEQTRK